MWFGDWSRDPGDEEILAIADQERRILVTLDKDFGELAVAEPLVAVFNFTCPGADVDLAVFKHNGIIVKEMVLLYEEG